MSRRAFRPKKASLLVWVTLEMATTLPGICMRVYLKSKLVQVQFPPKQQLKLNLLLQAGHPTHFIQFKDRNLVLELQDGALDFCQDFITWDLSIEQ